MSNEHPFEDIKPVTTFNTENATREELIAYIERMTGQSRSVNDAAQPENIYVLEELRPEGYWIRFKEFEHGYFHIKCSNCGQYWSIADHDKIFKYCFNCGAKMRGEAE